MALFAKRPEHEESAVSLPGEPLRRQSPAELLGEQTAVDLGAIDPTKGVASVSIPIDLDALETGTADGE